ncbi:MAG: glycosyltransferase [Spirochaetales bacterium]|nr:glycosyltransferase [Spirochaetales bacterium]
MASPFLNFILGVSLLSVILILLYLFRWIMVDLKKRRRKRARKQLESLLTGRLEGAERRKARRGWLYLLDSYIEMRQNMIPCDRGVEKFNALMEECGGALCLVRKLSKGTDYCRCRAIRYLGYLDCDISRKALVHCLRKEKKEKVKVYILHSLSLLNVTGAVPEIVDSLKDASSGYIDYASGVLQNFRGTFIAHFPGLVDHPDESVQKLLIQFARTVPNALFGDYLLDKSVDEQSPDALRILAFTALTESYPQLVDFKSHIRGENKTIRDTAIMGLAHSPSGENREILYQLLEDETTRETAEKSLANIISRDTNLFSPLLERCLKEGNSPTGAALSRVISSRIESILPLINRDNREEYGKIIGEVIRSGRISGLISFLNGNRNSEIEDILLSLINRTLEEAEVDVKELQIYLKPPLLEKLGLPPLPLPTERINEKRESIRKGPLIVILILVFSLLPLLFLHTTQDHHIHIGTVPFKETVNTYLLLFGYYCLGLNGLYFSLLIFSFLNARRQQRYWNLKDESLLFSHKTLPSLSILVPAYGEEQTIIENVNSLLNLKYPDYEVIVINDGSKDRTLQVLVDHFNLEKEDRLYEEKLKTQPVRGLYANRKYPELLVIDKINGGKADTLNTGLNLAGKDYFAGIDSDSLLDRDALLKLTSSFLDVSKPVFAAGGNILPINGCQVDRGVLEKKALPREPVALFQFIEYIRSFISGRMGWAYINSLLIISGAFGVFDRKRVLGINGYLTSREYYMKDTVGEDMELVVRLRRDLDEKKEAGAFIYQFQSDCWTEVPSRFSILRKQRERWQRGLIDIMTFHRKMIGNRRFGTAGLIGFPYYLIAEVVGPWFETLANLAFLPSLIAGWIPLSLLYLIIGSNFILSFALSLGSLIILEWDEARFSLKQRLALLLVCLLETLGFRQIMSFYRITGFVGILRNVTGWGTMTRRGFPGQGG